MGMKKIVLSSLLVLGMTFLLEGKEASAESTIEVNTISGFEDQVKENVKNYENNFDVHYTGDMSEFQKSARTILPKIIDQEDIVAGTLSSYRQTIRTSSEKGQIEYEVKYFTSKEKDHFADQQIKKEVAKIKKTAKSDYDKVKAVNDFIVSNTSYGGNSGDRFTAYGLMKSGKAVCQGYALVTLKMLEQLNIPVRYVVGVSLDQNHAWNKVKVDGKWYNLDTTWNDPTPNSPTEIQYNYFLVSDKQLAKDHTWTRSNYPSATSSKYDFLADASSAVQVGNKFYYSSMKNKEQIYVKDLKTGKGKKLTKHRGQYLVAAKGKIYFSNFSNGAFLYSINTNGKSLKKLNSRNSQYLQVKGSYIHYKTGSKAYKMKI